MVRLCWETQLLSGEGFERPKSQNLGWPQRLDWLRECSASPGGAPRSAVLPLKRFCVSPAFTTNDNSFINNEAALARKRARRYFWRQASCQRSMKLSSASQPPMQPVLVVHRDRTATHGRRGKPVVSGSKSNVTLALA